MRGPESDPFGRPQQRLDATEAAQRSGRAFVRILEEGSVQAIQQALSERRYHILHISCHANERELHGSEVRLTGS